MFIYGRCSMLPQRLLAIWLIGHCFMAFDGATVRFENHFPKPALKPLKQMQVLFGKFFGELWGDAIAFSKGSKGF